MESLMTLAITDIECMANRETYPSLFPIHSIHTYIYRFHPPSFLSSTRLVAPSPLDLHLALRKSHGKFDDISYYRNQMHKEQTRDIRKFTMFFQKMGGGASPLPTFGHVNPLLTFLWNQGVSRKAW